MWWLIPVGIVAGLIIIVAIILSLRVKIYVTANAEEQRVTYKLLFLKGVLLPEDEETKAKKKEKKRAKKAKKIEAAEKQGVQNAAREVTKNDIIASLKAIVSLLKTLYNTRDHLKVILHRLYIKVGAEDAATTAWLYGAICVVNDELVKLLDEFIKYKQDKDSVDISADFTAEKMDAAISLEIDISVFYFIVYLAKDAFVLM